MSNAQASRNTTLMTIKEHNNGYTIAPSDYQTKGAMRSFIWEIGTQLKKTTKQPYAYIVRDSSRTLGSVK